MTIKCFKELIKELKDDDYLVLNENGNLAIVRNKYMIGCINLQIRKAGYRGGYHVDKEIENMINMNKQSIYI